MGNVQTQEQVREQAQKGAASGAMDKEKLYRLFGIRLANEGDGYDIMGQRRLEIQRDQVNNEPKHLEDYPKKPSAGPARSLVALCGVAALSDAAALPEYLGNPGTVAELHRHCHDMLPLTFEGFRLNINRSLTDCVSVGHSLQLGGGRHSRSAQLSCCQFNSNYAGQRLHELTGEAYPQLTGEVDARGNVSGTLMHFMGSRWRGKVTATLLDSELHSSRVFLDYFGTDFTCTCVLSNLDLVQQMGVFVASYLQQVTPQLALGVDLIYQREDIVPVGQASLISAVARYQQDNGLWSAMLSLHALEFCYSQLYGESLGASVQLQANILKRQAISRLSYYGFIPKVGFTIRGGIDTRGVISAVCEKRLDPLPVLLTLSGKLNHLNNHYKFGLGLIVG